MTDDRLAAIRHYAEGPNTDGVTVRTLLLEVLVEVDRLMAVLERHGLLAAGYDAERDRPEV